MRAAALLLGCLLLPLFAPASADAEPRCSSQAWSLHAEDRSFRTLTFESVGGILRVTPWMGAGAVSGTRAFDADAVVAAWLERIETDQLVATVAGAFDGGAPDVLVIGGGRAASTPGRIAECSGYAMGPEHALIDLDPGAYRIIWAAAVEDGRPVGLALDGVENLRNVGKRSTGGEAHHLGGDGLACEARASATFGPIRAHGGTRCEGAWIVDRVGYSFLREGDADARITWSRDGIEVPVDAPTARHAAGAWSLRVDWDPAAAGGSVGVGPRALTGLFVDASEVGAPRG